MANPIASDIIGRVRALMQDEQAPYRYSDAQVLDAINDGVQRLVQLRPDYFIAVNFDPTEVTATTDTVQVPSTARFTLTMFTAGYLSLREDEFATDGRAAALINAPASQLTDEGRSQGSGVR